MGKKGRYSDFTCIINISGLYIFLVIVYCKKNPTYQCVGFFLPFCIVGILIHGLWFFTSYRTYNTVKGAMKILYEVWIMKKVLYIVLAFFFVTLISPNTFAEKNDPIGNIIPSQPESMTFNNTENSTNIFSSVEYTEPVPTDDLSEQKATDTTLLIYMCGSTMEGIDSWGDECYLASADICEICSSGVNSNRVNVILYAGGCKQWGVPEIRDGTCGVYQIANGKIRALVNDGKIYNMGEPSTLSAFLQYGYDTFPAEHYALILWDHGGGALGEVCHDVNFPSGDSYSDGLTMEELDTALAQSPFAEVKLDWIGFDACLMSALETASVVAPYARYMVASEETEYGEGWDYRFLKNMENDKSPVETGTRIVDYYKTAMAAMHPSHNNTLSCVDLSRVSTVLQTLDEYFKDITIQPENNKEYKELFTLRRSLLSYGVLKNRSNSYDLIDLGEMIDRFVESGIGNGESGNAFKEALKKCVQSSVPGKRLDKKGGTGLSVYFPCDNIAEIPLRIMEYQRVGGAPKYAGFIESFGKILYANHYEQFYNSTESQDDLINYQISNGSNLWNSMNTDSVPMSKDNRSLFKLALSADQLEEYYDARGFAFQRAAETDAYRLVAIEDKVDLKDDQTIEGEYKHVNLFVLNQKNSSGGEMIPIPYAIRLDGLYEIEAELVNASGKRCPAHLVFQRNIKDEISPADIDVYLYDRVLDDYSPRLNTHLSDFAEVIFTIQDKRIKLDENGTLLPYEYWEEDEKHEISWKLDGDAKLSFLKDQLDMKTLYFAFEITDIFNNAYLSKPICMVDEEDIFSLNYDDGREIGRPAFFTLDDVRIQNSGSNAAYFSVVITNLTDSEPIYAALNLNVNGQDYDLADEVHGSAASMGFLNQESKPLSFLIDIEGGKDAIKTVCFDLLVGSTDGEVLYSTPVKVLYSTPAVVTN